MLTEYAGSELSGVKVGRAAIWAMMVDHWVKIGATLYFSKPVLLLLLHATGMNSR